MRSLVHLKWSSYYLSLTCFCVTFSLVSTSHFPVQVSRIFISFFTILTFLAISTLLLVRCAIIWTPVPFSVLPCFSDWILCFLFTNWMRIFGLLLDFWGKRWQAVQSNIFVGGKWNNLLLKWKQLTSWCIFSLLVTCCNRCIGAVDCLKARNPQLIRSCMLLQIFHFFPVFHSIFLFFSWITAFSFLPALPPLVPLTWSSLTFSLHPCQLLS